MNYQKGISNFLSHWLANRQWLYWQVNHGAYSNPCTQVGAQSKDLGAVSQMDKPDFSFLCSTANLILWAKMYSPNKEIHLPGLCAFVGEWIQWTRLASFIDINPFITNPAHEEVFHTTGGLYPLLFMNSSVENSEIALKQGLWFLRRLECP